MAPVAARKCTGRHVGTRAAEAAKLETTAPTGVKEKQARSPRSPRRPLSDNLAFERVVEPSPCACGKCGGIRLRTRARPRGLLDRSPARGRRMTPARPQHDRAFANVSAATVSISSGFQMRHRHGFRTSSSAVMPHNSFDGTL
jgi:hypothetical protein